MTGVVAVDIGGSSVKAALVTSNEPGVTQGRTEHKTGTEDAEESFAAVVACIRDVEEHARTIGVEIAGYGVASPGPMDVGRNHITKPQLGWDEFPLRKHLLTELGESVDLRIENDANTAALGCWYNAGVFDRSLLLVTVSTGVGAGFVLPGGVVLTGHTGNAAEFGHIPFGENKCEFDHGHGCLEGSVAGSGIEKRFGIAPKNVPAELRRRIAEELGAGMAGAVSLLDPGSIVLMGSVAIGFQEADERDGLAPHECFIEVVRSCVKEITVNHVDVDMSFSPFIDDTGIIGAAALVLTRRPRFPEKAPS